MDRRRDWAASLAALSGAVAVTAGAFAAHAVRDLAARELLRTGATYQATHALAALIAALAGGRLGRGARPATWLFLAGTVLFSGSLYGLALGAPRLVGAIAPLGGLALIAGWLALAFAARPLPAKSIASESRPETP